MLITYYLEVNYKLLKFRYVSYLLLDLVFLFRRHVFWLDILSISFLLLHLDDSHNSVELTLSKSLVASWSHQFCVYHVFFHSIDYFYETLIPNFFTELSRVLHH